MISVRGGANLVRVTKLVLQVKCENYVNHLKNVYPSTRFTL
jgi:hypothetical protein